MTTQKKRKSKPIREKLTYSCSWGGRKLAFEISISFFEAFFLLGMVGLRSLQLHTRCLTKSWKRLPRDYKLDLRLTQTHRKLKIKHFCPVLLSNPPFTSSKKLQCYSLEWKPKAWPRTQPIWKICVNTHNQWQTQESNLVPLIAFCKEALLGMAVSVALCDWTFCATYGGSGLWRF